jgi:hypothetical protein
MKKSSINQGIQAGSVHANALAVGTKARATVTTRSPDQQAVLDALTAAIGRLSLDPAHREAMLGDVKAMQAEAAPASTFAKIVSAVKDLGHAAELVAPLSAVAKAFGLPVPF